MRYLSGDEEKEAIYYLQIAAVEAAQSGCARSRCGSVIVLRHPQNTFIVGKGFNSPPAKSVPRCNRKHEIAPDFKSDKTCCVHAEQRAIMDMLKRYPEMTDGHYWTRLYFIRLDDNGDMKHSGKPYCTICSKMSLDAGVREFVLWHKEGVCVYDTYEYNELSFSYGKEELAVEISKIIPIGD